MAVQENNEYLFNMCRPREEDETWLKNIVAAGIADYIFYQLEIPVDCGEVHLSGYVQWSSPKSLAACKLLYSMRWEPLRLTTEEALRYIAKDEIRLEGPFELGARKKPVKLKTRRSIADPHPDGSEFWYSEEDKIVYKLK